MEIEGHCYAHNVTKIEIEKVRGQYSDFVRVRINGADDVLSFACWGVRPPGDEFGAMQQPEVIITRKDEREPADAIDEHSEESDR